MTPLGNEHTPAFLSPPPPPEYAPARLYGYRELVVEVRSTHGL